MSIALPAVARIVTYVDPQTLPPRAGEQDRLALLRDRALLRTLWATGMRREELSRLNCTDIQDGRAAEGLVTGKGGKDRVVFFDEFALEAIRAYLAARGDTFLPLYVRHDDGRGRPGQRGERWRLSPQSVWGIDKKYAALAGVDATTHHLRHLKARVLLNGGALLAEVSRPTSRSARPGPGSPRRRSASPRSRTWSTARPRSRATGTVDWCSVIAAPPPLASGSGWAGTAV